MLQYKGTGSRTQECPRRRKVAAVLGGAGVVGILVAGLVLSVASLMHPGGHVHAGRTDHAGRRPSSSPQAVSAAVARARDELAARPMPDTGTGHEYGRPDLSTRNPGAPLVLPPAHGISGYGVTIGYPQTPQGAVAQLATIDAAALRSASLPGARAVIREWAAPGGPTETNWSVVKAMADLLEKLDVTSIGSPLLNIKPTPAMALIKGTVGDDFVVACVDFAIDVTYGGSWQTAAVDCQRMLWTSGQWMIGPGREPAEAPSVWPDTDAALTAGYKDVLSAGAS